MLLAIRVVVGGIRLAWVSLPSSTQSAIIAAAAAQLQAYADKLNCDYSGVPYVEIGKRIVQAGGKINPDDAFTVIGKLTGIDFPQFLWFRVEIGDKIIDTCAFTSDPLKAKTCGLRLYEKYQTLNAEGKKTFDAFTLGYRFTNPFRKGKGRILFIPKEVITDESFLGERVGKELAKDVTDDEEPKDNSCYGFFLTDYCEPPETSEPGILQPAPKVKFLCGRYPFVHYSKDNIPINFYVNTFMKIAEPEPGFEPDYFYVQYSFIDAKGNLHEATFETVDPDTGEIIPPIHTQTEYMPILPRKGFSVDSDKTVAWLRGEDIKDVYIQVPAQGVVTGSIVPVYEKPVQIEVPDPRNGGVKRVPAMRQYHSYFYTVPEMHVIVDPFAFPTDAQKCFIDCWWHYPKGHAGGYQPGFGKKSSYEYVEQCYVKTDKPPKEDTCKKGWKQQGDCFVYDSCGNESNGVDFHICGGFANGFPHAEASVTFPALTDEYGTRTTIQIGTDGLITVTTK